MSREIDPLLPFLQVDRSALHAAALLAPSLEVTAHHAVGAMVSFWSGLADRRLLAPLVHAGKRKLVLHSVDVANRLRLAFGRAVPLELFVAAGFLEPDKDSGGAGYRIRGMSRYIEAEALRLSRKRGESKGSPSGVQPPFNPPPTPLEPPSNPPSTPLERHKREEERGERREEREEREEERGKAAAPPPRSFLEPLQPEKPEHEWGALDFLQWTQFTRVDAGLRPERLPRLEKVERWWSKARERASVADLREAYLRFGDDAYWQKKDPPLPLGAFLSQWEDYWSPHAA